MATTGPGRFAVEKFRHVALEETQSTNSDCLARARIGDPGLLWITAERQTVGRGRRGRPWVSESGNLYASMLLINAAPLDIISSLPLGVALAVREAMMAVLPLGGPVINLKWPNDVMIEGRKTCGILLEGETLPNGDHALVIGCGINIAHKPETSLYPATCLGDHGVTVGPQEFFAHLVMTMAEMLERWDEGRGTALIVDEWRSHAMGLGEPIRVNLPSQSISGIFSGIDDAGLLQLETADGAILPIAAGDVFFS